MSMIFLTHQIPVGRKFVCASVLSNGAVHCEDRVMGVGVSEFVWIIGGMTLTGGTWSTGRETCPTVTSSSTNCFTDWPVIKPGYWHKRPATGCRTVTRTAPHSHFIYEMTLTWWLYVLLQHCSVMTRGKYLPAVRPPVQEVPSSLWSGPSRFSKQTLVSKT